MAEAAHHIECSICLAYVNPDTDKLVNLIKCGHVFHNDCILAWFDQGFDSTKPCPQCRKPSSRRDMRTIFLQTKPDEQTEDMKKELEKVREQLKKEKEKKAKGKTSAVDPAVESLVSLTAKMRVAEAATAQRAVFLPNSRHFLFEGCQSPEDSIHFREYAGPKNWHHGRSKCYSPTLQPGSSLGKDTIHNSLMNTIFHQQMEVVKKSYDEAQDGLLELTVKFGRLYLFQAPSSMSMLVRDFNYGIGIQHKKADPQAIRTSFVPTETLSDHVKRILIRDGFHETKKEEAVVVNVDHSKARPRIVFEVYLDKDLKFKSLRQNDRSFLNIDIRRKDTTKPDIRLAMKSVDEEFVKGNLKPPAKSYARDNLVKWDPSQPTRLIIDRSALGKVPFARWKKMTYFRKQTSPNALEKVIEVKIIETTSYEDAQYNGTFKRMKTQTEVYIRINGKDDLYKVCEDEEFLQNLLMFCDKFQ